LKLHAEKLSSHLQNNLAPCYLVSGNEHLLLEEALDQIRAAARERGFESRESFVAMANFNWSQLAGVASNMSLFADKRIVEVRLPTGKPGREGSAAICEFVDNLSPEFLMIVVAPRLTNSNKNSKWVKTLSANGDHLPVWDVDLRELPRWISTRMRNAGLKPDRDAVRMIADRVEGNLLAANQEIEKLRIILGEGAVTGEDVAKAVANNSRYDVYKLVDAAVGGNAKRAMKILNGLRGEGVAPVIMTWALTQELRVLAMLSDSVRNDVDLGAAMQKHRVWNNRQAMVRACIGRHQHTGLYRLLKAIGRADAAAKGQATGDPWQLGADIVLGLSLGGRKAA
jgi:DNA polymerase III subunit delta